MMNILLKLGILFSAVFGSVYGCRHFGLLNTCQQSTETKSQIISASNSSKPVGNSAIDFAAFSKNHLVRVDSNGLVEITKDSGNTWTTTFNLETPSPRAKLRRVSNSAVILVTKSNVYRSDDLGTTWDLIFDLSKRADFGEGTIENATFASENQNVGWVVGFKVAVGQDEIVEGFAFETLDGGKTWYRVLIDNPETLSVGCGGKWDFRDVDGLNEQNFVVVGACGVFASELNGTILRRADDSEGIWTQVQLVGDHYLISEKFETLKAIFNSRTKLIRTIELDSVPQGYAFSIFDSNYLLVVTPESRFLTFSLLTGKEQQHQIAETASSVIPNSQWGDVWLLPLENSSLVFVWCENASKKCSIREISRNKSAKLQKHMVAYG